MKVIHDERISPFEHIDLIVYGLVFWLVKSSECATRNCFLTLNLDMEMTCHGIAVNQIDGEIEMVFHGKFFQ